MGIKESLLGLCRTVCICVSVGQGALCCVADAKHETSHSDEVRVTRQRHRGCARSALRDAPAASARRSRRAAIGEPALCTWPFAEVRAHLKIHQNNVPRDVSSFTYLYARRRGAFETRATLRTSRRRYYLSCKKNKDGKETHSASRSVLYATEPRYRCVYISALE